MTLTQVSDQRITLPSSLQSVIQTLETAEELSPAKVRRVLLDHPIQESELMPWADFDHPTADSYGRKLVHQGDRFEVMVMSWLPGDFSAIHDHGHTQWGAVQVFGPAEHATFREENGKLRTLARWEMKPHDIVGVSHDLIHQMGNSTTDQRFISLHIYGAVRPHENITGDARIFDVHHDRILRVDGGVFYALPAAAINRIEMGPSGDFPTQVRQQIELIQRLRKMESEDPGVTLEWNQLIQELFSSRQQEQLIAELKAKIDENGHVTDTVYWRSLRQELKVAAQLQQDVGLLSTGADAFHTYASMYDALICEPCLDDFIRAYLQFFQKEYDLNLAEKRLISLGCGTGRVEEELIHMLGVPRENMMGIDYSEAMVQVAGERIPAKQGNILQLEPSAQVFDWALSSLNVFQYLPAAQLEEAVQRTAALIRSGGYFVGDFITPDHLRWYPQVIFSPREDVISLRQPQLVEEEGRMFQESEIINLDFRGGRLRVDYAGKHRRHLAPMHRVRQYFAKAFGGPVKIYDAQSLQEVPEWADSCASTRYVLIAKKS